MQKRSKTSRSSKPADKKPAEPGLRATSDGPPAWIAALVLSLSICVVYWIAIDAPFIFDDAIGIVRNKSIQTLWPPIGTADNRGPLNPPFDNPVSARPLVNLTFAINYHLGGFSPAGYHVVSIFVHICSAILLWAVVRRALRLPYFAGRFDSSASWLAFIVALLWALHPLQTEAVIYASQRTELMMAMFYIATLYCSLRYWALLSLPLGEGRGEGASRERTVWLLLAVAACLCGMASKEVMVSAPLLVLLFDRTFVAGSLPRALRRTWPFYIGLAATWLLLLFLNIGAPRGASAGFDLGVSPYMYWLTQSKVLLMYLNLVFWPWPLLVHYELPYFSTFSLAWMYVVPVLLTGLATLVLLWRNHPIGFLGTAIFAILAPTSVVPIVTEIAAERRMYLPLAFLLVLLTVAAYFVAQRVWRNRAGDNATRFGLEPALFAIVLPALALTLLCSVLSVRRLDVYHSPLAVWEEVLRVQPYNSVAHQNKGFLLDQAGNLPGAIDEFREAVRLAPDALEAIFNLSTLLLKAGRPAEAVDQLRTAVEIIPNDAPMRNNLATALSVAKRYEESITAFRATLDLDPNNWTIHKNLGMTQQKAGKYLDAIASFENVLRLNPSAIDIYLNIADNYSLARQSEKATAALQQGLERARAAGDVATAAKFTARLGAQK